MINRNRSSIPVNIRAAVFARDGTFENATGVFFGDAEHVVERYEWDLPRLPDDLAAFCGQPVFSGWPWRDRLRDRASSAPRAVDVRGDADVRRVLTCVRKTPDGWSVVLSAREWSVAELERRIEHDCAGCRSVRRRGYGARHCLNHLCETVFYRVSLKAQIWQVEQCPDCGSDETESANPHTLLAVGGA